MKGSFRYFTKNIFKVTFQTHLRLIFVEENMTEATNGRTRSTIQIYWVFFSPTIAKDIHCCIGWKYNSISVRFTFVNQSALECPQQLRTERLAPTGVGTAPAMLGSARVSVEVAGQGPPSGTSLQFQCTYIVVFLI